MFAGSWLQSNYSESELSPLGLQEADGKKLTNVNLTLRHLALAVVLAGVPVLAADLAARHQEIPRSGSSPELGSVLHGLQTAEGKTNQRPDNAARIEWVRAGMNTNSPAWGFRGGLLWGLPSAIGQSLDGPRGLIRLRYPVLPNGDYDLLNFIAIEPVVLGRKGFSELERSQLDGVPGKRFWVDDLNTPAGPVTNLLAGSLARLDTGAECLSVHVRVERFENGAHVGLTLTQQSDAPDELELILHEEPDSAPIEYCILTATMGNKARARQLWLKDEVVSSLDLYVDYKDSGFASHRLFSLDRLQRTSTGEILAAITTDEVDPASVDPSPAAAHWRYGGYPVTQYWKKPAGTWRDDLQVVVNGRYTYWLSRNPIPGGVAFENFEMRERFHSGQRFVFGITRRTPGELGIGPAGRKPRSSE
jgi:hypothetical protein